MRKQDYATLARIIAANLLAAASNDHPQSRQRLEFVARQFAQRASVDAAAFLKACGID